MGHRDPQLLLLLLLLQLLAPTLSFLKTPDHHLGQHNVSQRHSMHAWFLWYPQKVKRFVEGKGSTMDYTVAVDTAGATEGERVGAAVMGGAQLW